MYHRFRVHRELQLCCFVPTADSQIDLISLLNHPDNYANVHLSTVLPALPALRGVQGLTYSAVHAPPANCGNSYEAILGATDAGRSATRAQINVHTEWVKWRTNRGLPPWTKMSDYKDFMQSTDTKGKGKGKVALTGDEDESGRDDEVTVGNEEQNAEREALLKTWCEKYVHDRGLLKEFRMETKTWGWDLDGLTTGEFGSVRPVRLVVR